MSISAYGNDQSFAVCANTTDQSGNEYFYLPIEGQATDPQGRALSWTWTQTLDGGSAATIGTDQPPQTFRVFHVPSDGANPTTNVISATVRDGIYTTTVSLTGTVYPSSHCVPPH